MIYTLTLNPAIDYTVAIDHPPVRGSVNRLQAKQLRIGCKRLTADGVPDYAYALRLGMAADGATAFAEGYAAREETERLVN